jgi:SMC interacting uncharacterized protein involved in chromosome segregation
MIWHPTILNLNNLSRKQQLGNFFLTFSYDQTLTKTSEEKELIGKRIFKVLEELINFKTFVETSLIELEKLYEREISEN